MIRRALRLSLALLAAPAAAGDLPLQEPEFAAPDMARVRLGQLLFYDPILSGNRTVSCATCHHPRFATSDGLSLGLGDGGRGLGPDRVADPANLPEERVPRNSPALFNLGAAEFTRFFADGRLEDDPTRPHGIRTPLGEDMAEGFQSALSAQAMFPVLSPDEMAGHYSESDVSQAVRQGFFTGEGGAWDILSRRVDGIPAYRAAFDPLIGQRPVAFTDIANVIADFIAFEWRADDSPFDRYIREGTPLDEDAAAGMAVFYGKAGCDGCHAGRLQTDHDFHAIAMSQLGPGKAARFERHARDTGRMRVTGDPADAFAFRTPSLRNVTETAPYGHTGAYATLEGVIRHHLDPVTSLQAYGIDQALLPALDVEDRASFDNAADRAALAGANALAPQSLTDAEVAQLVAFLDALTDETSLKGRLGVPDSVPSGLPVDR